MAKNVEIRNAKNLLIKLGFERISKRSTFWVLHSKVLGLAWDFIVDINLISKMRDPKEYLKLEIDERNEKMQYHLNNLYHGR